jgi:membrane protein insertase Oxa1/YidC/SpoIIIJ
MAVAMVISQKLMPASGPAQNPQQKIIMNVMPVLFAVICYNMPSGLNLYILTSTLLGIVQNYFIHVSDEDVHSKRKRPARRPKNFYAAAQMRKREMAKEARREKQSKRRTAKDKTTPDNKSSR